MRVSLNWIKSINETYGCAPNPASKGLADLVERIGSQLGAVEEVIDWGKKYHGIIVAKVISCVKHPSADKLKLCLVDDSGVVKAVKRNKDGLVQVVCGAPNVEAGQLVAWIPPGATVPATYNKDPLVLGAKEIRGQVSNGMLASAKELGLSDNHEGIFILDESAKQGQTLVEVYKLDDQIIDIENKMFTHRPDLFGMLGIARELAGIQHEQFKSPPWYKEAPAPANDARKFSVKLKIKNDVPDLIPRFCAVFIKDVKVNQSPMWLLARLSAVGIRPINNIVDITNFLMYETAQPLHAYDYDKLKTDTLGVRLNKKGEELKIIGGKTIKLEHKVVVITDGIKPIGLGGVMGGANTEVDNNTKNIVLECANFDMNATRRTAMAYGLFTDAATRFTKNQNPRQNLAVIVRAVDEIKKIAGGRQASPVADDKHFKNRETPISLNTSFINKRLGLNLTASQIKKLLDNVEFKVSTNGEKLNVEAPFWRTDIEIPEDIVEEVGRLYGYDHLPLELPNRSLTPAKYDPSLRFKEQLRSILSSAGANEVLTYSFVHGRLLELADQDIAKAFHIRNALSPDLQYYRQSLTPSLLEKIHPNIKTGYNQLALFELGRVHVRGVNDGEKLPAELERLSLVIGAKEPGQGAPYFAAKAYADYLLVNHQKLMNLSCRQIATVKNIPLAWQVAAQAYAAERTAVIFAGDEIVGLVGEPTVKLRNGLKLPAYTAQLELDISALARRVADNLYQSLNRYPSLSQDFCLRAPTDLNYAQLSDFIASYLGSEASKQSYMWHTEPIDIYQKDKTHKQTTWHITLEHPQRTLTTDEVNRLLDGLAKQARLKLKAERI